VLDPAAGAGVLEAGGREAVCEPDGLRAGRGGRFTAAVRALSFFAFVRETQRARFS
jgi:hypothetical protein